MTLPYEMYVDAIEEEAERIGDLAERGTKVAVRTFVAGDLEALLLHLAAVFRRSALCFDDADQEATKPRDAEAGRSALSAFEDARIELVSLFRERVAADQFGSGDDRELTAGDLARRLAHETAIHRVDAELARGRSTAIDPELAADGVDERLRLDLVSRLDGEEVPLLGGSICLICLDQADAWIVEVHRGRFQVRLGRGPADAAVVAPASDLFRFAWNRPTLRPLQVTGRMAVVEAWQTLPGEDLGAEQGL